MKKLGLVGGMGPESTVPYYRGIIYGVRERMGENVLPFLSLESVNVFDIQRFCNEGRCHGGAGHEGEGFIRDGA